MTDTPRERPLSPHLQVWRWHATMLTSILHRATGVVLYAGFLILAAWLLCLALGPESYAFAMDLLAQPLGQLVLAGIAVSLFFHLAKGLQHLVWDLGFGFGLAGAGASAVACIVFALLAAAAVFAAAYAGVFA